MPSVSSVGQIVTLCCKLHNYIIDESNDISVPQPSDADTDRHYLTVHPQGDCALDEELRRRRRDLEASDLRLSFTDEIRDLDLERPDASLR